MDALEIARWQFGITTVYHFLFVPLTIGLGLVVAVLQTLWYRSGNETWLRQTRFWGKLFLITFAMGVVTGIVQEFQFGMAWASYSRFVGDVFGAPLAMEGLAAFFLESTFLGLWIFGWDQLPRKVHLACIWTASIGTVISAYFILAANSWMQHPVGVTYNAETGRAELESIWAVLTNSTVLAAFPHTILGALTTAGAFVVGIAAWQIRRAPADMMESDRASFRAVMRGAMVLVLVSSLGVALSGHAQARLMIRQQPMKMASAEALCETESGAGFSLFAYGDVSKRCDVRTFNIPGLTSFLASDDFDSTVKGVNDLQAEYSERYGEANYRPPMAVTYWSFRLMIGFGVLAAAVAAWGLWQTRKHRELGPLATSLAVLAISTPFLANSFGWIFTEMGRQPWIVAPNPSGIDAVRLFTAEGVSGNVSSATLLTSVIVFTLLYGVLAVIEVGLLLRTIRRGPDDTMPVQASDDDGADRMSFAY
ncbi:MAG: cytochrome ubiquinol oxidase subunit I [Dehalococcoidia bacterium]